MKVEELRIGNYYRYYEGQFHGYIIGLKLSNLSVDGSTVTITAEGGGYTKTEAKDVSGLPLTEEWLLKFGFIKAPIYPNTWNKDGVSLWFYPERPSVMLHQCKPNNFNYRYVHELQNLFFALTGQELTQST